MSHCEHCHSSLHRRFFSVKRVGVVGGILMVLHLLFHLVEFLLLPTVFVAFGGHVAEAPAVATSEQTTDDTTAAISPTLPILSAELLLAPGVLDFTSSVSSKI